MTKRITKLILYVTFILVAVFYLASNAITSKVNADTSFGITSCTMTWGTNSSRKVIDTHYTYTGDYNYNAFYYLYKDNANVANVSLSTTLTDNISMADFITTYGTYDYHATTWWYGDGNYWLDFAVGTSYSLTTYTEDLPAGAYYGIMAFDIDGIEYVGCYTGVVYIKDIKDTSNNSLGRCYIDSTNINGPVDLPSYNTANFMMYSSSTSTDEQYKLTESNGTFSTTQMLNNYKTATTLYAHYYKRRLYVPIVNPIVYTDNNVNYYGYEKQNSISSTNYYLINNNSSNFELTYEGEYPTLTISKTSFEKTGYIFEGLYTVTTETRNVTVNGSTTSRIMITEYLEQYYDADLTKVKTESLDEADLYLYPKYTPALTINFNSNGGSGTMESVVVEYGDSVTLPTNTLTKSGFIFLGWNTNSTATTVLYNDCSSFTNSIVSQTGQLDLYAIWVINEFTLRIDKQNGEEIASYVYTYGDTIASIEDPTRTGYTFNGWDKTIPSTMPANDLTITAKWLKNGKVYYYLDAVTLYQEYSFVEGDSLTSLSVSDPTKTGYRFNGWNKTLPSVMPANDITITAKWLKLYNLNIYKEQGGEVIVTSEYIAGETISSVSNPTKYGYKFLGWSEDIPSTMPENDLTIYGTWAIGTFKIIINAAPAIISPISYEYGATVQKIADPIVPGYLFKGWDRDWPETMPGENVTINAILEQKDYTIVIKLNNGDSDLTYTVGVNMAFPSVTTPTKEHYTFVSWSEELPSTVTSDMIIDAIWEPNSHTITFRDSNNGEDIIQTKKYGETIVIPTAIKSGYEFMGWDKTIPETMPDEDLEFSPLWLGYKYSLKLDYDNGEAIYEAKYSYKEVITTPTIPTKEGYTFVSWDSQIPKIMPNYDINFKAIWQKNTYKITYYVDDEIYLENNVGYMEEIPEVQDPTKEGYVFLGWNTEIPSTMPASDLTYTAVFVILSYFVDFLDENDNIIESQLVAYNTNAIDITHPKKENYVFSGWLTVKGDSTSLYDFSTLVTGEFKLYPYFVEMGKNDKLNTTDENCMVTVYCKDGFYEDIVLTVDITTNEELGDIEKVKKFLVDYERYSEYDYLLGAVYNVKLYRNDEEYIVGDVKVTLELTELLKENPKFYVYHVTDSKTATEITEYEIKDGKLIISTNGLNEFAIFYSKQDQVDDEKSGALTYIIIGGIALTATLTTAFVAIGIHKKRKKIRDAFEW